MENSITKPEPKKLTITITGARPVTIVEDNWPVRAEASWKDWDNQYECQANCTWRVWIKVRQHIDGRTIVYGRWCYTTQYQDASGSDYRSGLMLTPSAGEYPPEQRTAAHDWVGQRVVDAIHEVGTSLIGQMEDGGDGEYAHRVRECVTDCIANLPAEELA